MTITRRVFLYEGAFACAGLSAFPVILPRTSISLKSPDNGKRVVVIYLRGGADGLNMVVPHGEAAYYAMRPSTNIPRNAVLDLDGFFGLHPALSSLKPLWDCGQMAIVHAAGSPHPSRAHFEAQDFLASGIPGVRNAGSSWMSRVAGEVTQTHYASQHFGNTMPGLSQLIRTNPNTELLSSEMGGWDHHSNQGGSEGSMAKLLRHFSHSLTAFWTDLGALRESTVVVTLSEFGRSLRENNRGGTDHGHGSVIFILGTKLKGKKVYGEWPGLIAPKLYDERDLAVTTDFRRVLGEVLDRHLGNTNLTKVFPGFDNPPARFLNFLT